MTLDSALSSMLTQRCDVYHRQLTTSSSLGAKYRSYADTADIQNVPCLVRNLLVRGRQGALDIRDYGELLDVEKMLIYESSVDIRLDDQIVVTRWSDGSAMSDEAMKDHTYVVTKIDEAIAWTGHCQGYLKSRSKLYG